MQFENSFDVDAPIDRVWTYLLDVQSVAPCLPGAELTEIVSDTQFKGTVKIKLGAMQMNYKGTLVLKEVDNEAHRVVLTATGSDARGGGGASGTVTSTLTGEGPNRTRVHLVSEVNITGRVAQFGRNIIQDVSSKLIREFAQCLEANLTTEEAPSTADDVGASPTFSAHTSPSAQPVSEPVTSSSPAAVVSQDSTRDTPRPIPAAPRPTSRASTKPSGATEIKIMPLLVDVTRARVARGLRTLAKVLDTEK